MPASARVIAVVVFAVVVNPSLTALPADGNDANETGRLEASKTLDSCGQGVTRQHLLQHAMSPAGVWAT
jgi:hypothetical protein